MLQSAPLEVLSSIRIHGEEVAGAAQCAEEEETAAPEKMI
jgi:hypothetical protein